MKTAAQVSTGFTLLEMLVVVGILTILALAVFVSIDPLTQFAESRNARRWNDVNSLSTAVYRYIITNNSYPVGVSTTLQQIGTGGSGCAAACPGATDTCLDLSNSLSAFLIQIPQDPAGGSAAQTHYTIVRNNDNIVTVSACGAENNQIIKIAR